LLVKYTVFLSSHGFLKATAEQRSRQPDKRQAAAAVEAGLPAAVDDDNSVERRRRRLCVAGCAGAATIHIGSPQYAG
jgi:hypothetical protein